MMGAINSAPRADDKGSEPSTAKLQHPIDGPDGATPHGGASQSEKPSAYKAARSRASAGNKVIYSLNVTLRCTEDGSKRERALDLTWVPETIADLQDEIQDQFNIPVFDQKLKFGPAVLSSKESIQSYSLRNGDSITVEYTSEADIKEIMGVVSCIQKTLAFVESVQQQLFLFPIPIALQAQLQQYIDTAELDKLPIMSMSSSPLQRFMNVKVFIHSGGLTCLQSLHSLLLQLPFRLMTIHLQLLETCMNKLLWTLSSCPEAEASVLNKLKWDNIVQSLLRVTAISDTVIVPPENHYTEAYGNIQTQVVVELLTVAMGCLSCVLEYDAPQILHSLVSNQKFVEQVLGALQSASMDFRARLTVMCVIVDLAYNVEVHASLCKPHVIQAIIRTWKSADPTPENNAKPNESTYLKYLTVILLSLLCSTRQSFSVQYLQITELMENFIEKVDSNELHAIEEELGIHWNKYHPYMRVAYLPYLTERSVLACGSQPRYRDLQMLCIETCVLSLQVSLRGGPERKRIVQQGFVDYVVCLPSVLPGGSRAQKRAEDLLVMLGKEMHLEPPSLNTMARARLAVSGIGLDQAMKTPVQQLLSDMFA